jgi:iron complex outermembrane receptor protein
VPTIAERFVEASFAGSLNLIPNIDLIPEYSYNFDLGIKQSLRVKSWLGYFDASVFMMDFTNMIEYNLGSFQITKPDGTVTNVLGFKPENVYRARVAGIETSISGMGKVGSVPVRLLVGYTYVYPGDLSGDSSLINIGNYVKNMFTDFTRMKQIGDPSILKYRNRHVFRFDGEFDYKKFSPGFTIMYNSFFENMDAYLAFFDLETYLNKREGRSGDWVFDARMGYNFNDNFRLSALVRNITNLEYADRPGIMSSPRSFMVQFRYTL